MGINLGCGALDSQQCPNKILRHDLTADREIVYGALGLSGVQDIYGNLHFSHTVFYCSGIGHGGLHPVFITVYRICTTGGSHSLRILNAEVTIRQLMKHDYYC